MPVVHPVQPLLNDTVVSQLRAGRARARTVDTTTTLSGLAVPIDLDGTTALEIARASGSQGVLIDDDDAIVAQRRLMVEEGLLVEPAGAVSVAGFLRAVRDGGIAPDHRVVCILTGHGFKDPVSLEAASQANPVREIEQGDIVAVLDAQRLNEGPR